MQKAAGILNVLKRSTPGYAPLQQEFYAVLTRVGEVGPWGKYDAAFKNVVKKVLKDNLQLSMREWWANYPLYTDWSGSSSGYVLMQADRPIVVGSKVNRGWQAACSSFLGETYTIVWALKQVAAIIRGHKLTMHKDSATSMQKLMRLASWFKDGDARLARLLGYLEGNFAVGTMLKIKHIEGRHNILADLLSRWKTSAEVSTVSGEDAGMKAGVEDIRKAHEGHLKTEKMRQMLMAISKQVTLAAMKACVHKCWVSQQFAEKRSPVALGNMQAGAEPQDVVGIDVVGPLPLTKGGYMYVLTLICHSSRLAIAVPRRNADNVAVRAGLQYWQRRYGTMQRVLCDGAKVFLSHEVSLWLHRNGEAVFLTEPYSHKSAGMVERYHRTLEARLGDCKLAWSNRCNKVYNPR